MNGYVKSNFLRKSVLAFIGMPLLICAMGHLPERTTLKEALFVITILAFSQMIGQLFWARTDRSAVADLRMGKIIKYHKLIGYTCVSIMLLHPAFIVVPRFFESGVAPVNAYRTGSWNMLVISTPRTVTSKAWTPKVEDFTSFSHSFHGLFTPVALCCDPQLTK